MIEPLFNDGKCLLVKTSATSVTASCILCDATYDSIDVVPGRCKNPLPLCTYEEALRSRIPGMVKSVIGYSRFYLFQILTGRATPASQHLIDARAKVCESNVCGLYVDMTCSDCRCPMNHMQAHRGRNGAAWVEKTCRRGYWKEAESNEKSAR